jgi:hypothetical protein
MLGSMLSRGGNTDMSRLGVRPNIDYAFVASSPDDSKHLALESDGLWTKVCSDNSREPIGLALLGVLRGPVTPRELVEEYAPLVEDEKMIGLAGVLQVMVNPEDLENMKNESIAFEERQALFMAQIEPYWRNFYDANYARLLQELVRGMQSAFEGMSTTSRFRSRHRRRT